MTKDVECFFKILKFKTYYKPPVLSNIYKSENSYKNELGLILTTFQKGKNHTQSSFLKDGLNIRKIDNL